jgi:nitrite reductase/ring-hydroxylating ferredoxin subunit
MGMAAGERLICASGALVERGAGVRFEVDEGARAQAAFVVRFDGIAHAYLNRCAHIPVELDWEPARFFDLTGFDLICATHGASYDPRTGRCRGGPCRGQGLVKLPVVEHDDAVWLVIPPSPDPGLHGGPGS